MLRIPFGIKAKLLGNAVPTRDKNVVSIPIATMDLRPPIATNVEHTMQRIAVIFPAKGLVTEKQKRICMKKRSSRHYKM